MREKLEKMIGVKAASKRDEDIVKNMTALVREKDAMIDRMRAEISSLIVSETVFDSIQAREKELKNTISNYDLIYRKEGQEKQLKKEDTKQVAKKKLTVEEDAVEYLNQLKQGREFEQ